jgi:hypothetical protein
MTRALKVAMIVIGVIMILLGLNCVFNPDGVAEMHGLAESIGAFKWLAAVFGASLITIGVWAIVAGRDPLRNIYMVKLIITLSILFLVVNIYSTIQGYLDFSAVLPHIILDVVFAAALLICYPWRAARHSE